MLAKIKQWGNSLAVVIPRNKVEEFRLKAGEIVAINLEKKSNVLKELFGAIHFSKPVEKLLKESREKTSKWE